MLKGIKNRITGKKKRTYKLEQTACEYGNGFQPSVRTLSLRSLDQCCSDEFRFDRPYYRSDSENSFSLQDLLPEASEVNDEHPTLEDSSLDTTDVNATSTCTDGRKSTSSLTPSSQPTDERNKPQQRLCVEPYAGQNECMCKPTDKRYNARHRVCVMADARQNACSCNKIEDTEWNYKLPSSEVKMGQNETVGTCSRSNKESSSGTSVQETDRHVLQPSQNIKSRHRVCVVADARQTTCSCNKIEDTEWNYKLPSSQVKTGQNETDGTCSRSYKEPSSGTSVQETDRKVLQPSQNFTRSSYSINADSDSDDYPYSHLPDEKAVLRHSNECGQDMEEDYDEIPESNLVVNKRSSTLSIDSAFSDKSSASVSSIETNLRPFQKFVEESVSATDILPCLTCIGERDEKHITAIDRDDPVKAMQILLCRLKDIREPGKWQQFIEALEQKEYVLIAMVLKGESLKTYDEERKLIRILASELIKNIYPADFVDKLFEKGVISEHDKETIERREKQDGAEAATSLLLQRMTTKSPNWFKEFVQVCKDCHLDQTQYLAPLFDPIGEFDQASPDGRLHMYKRPSAKRGLPPPPLAPRRLPRTRPDGDYKTSEPSTSELQPPPLPNTLPPKGKPQHYQSNTSLHCISEQGADSPQSNNSDEDSVTYVDSDSLYTSRNDRIPMLKRKKNLLEKTLKNEKAKAKLRREINNLQEQIDDIPALEHTEVTVVSGYKSNYSRHDIKSVQHSMQESEGSARRNSAGGPQSPDVHYKMLQTRLERIEEIMNAKRQTRYVKELSTRLTALEKDVSGVSDSDEELYEQPDAEEENEETSRYISQDLQTADDDYDEADNDKGRAPQSDSSVPKRDLIDKMKEELKTHISDEIQKLHLSNMYGYTDGYRTAHLNEKMLLYTAGQDYRGITIPLGRTGSISQFPSVFMPNWSYYNLDMPEST